MIALHADIAKNIVACTDLGCGSCGVLHILRSMKARRISFTSLFNEHLRGMIVDATENIQTTVRKSGSNESHGRGAAGATAAPSSPDNPGLRLEASNRRNNWRPREVARDCPAKMVQNRLLLRCRRGLRCFRIAWQ